MVKGLLLLVALSATLLEAQNILVVTDDQTTGTSITNGLNAYFQLIKSAFPSVSTPVIQLASGTPLQAVNQVYAAVSGSGTVDAVIGSDNPTTSAMLAQALASWSVSIPLVLPVTAITSFTQGNYPLTIRISPQDSDLVARMADVVVQFGWAAIAVVGTSDPDGTSQFNAFLAQIATRTGVSVVYSGQFSLVANTTSDAAIAASITASKTVGVVAFMAPGQLSRLTNALGSAATGLYFVLGKDSTGETSIPTNAVVVTPSFSTQLQALPGTLSVKMQYLASYYFDAFAILLQGFSIQPAVRNAALANALQTITGVTLPNGPFTGVSVSIAAGTRVAGGFLMLQNVNGAVSSMGNVAAGSYQFSGSTPPLSPLRVVTVCAVAPNACGPIAALSHLLLNLNQASTTGALGTTGIVVRPISAGADGVLGLTSLAAAGSTCKFLVGPGWNSIVGMLTPIVNAFNIPQLDYSATSATFSDKTAYPLFSRVIASTLLQSTVISAVVNNYGWQSVQLIVTQDNSAFSQQLMTALATTKVTIEATYVLNSVTNATLWNALNTIATTGISRIIIAAPTVTQDGATLFFNIVQQLQMTSSVFLLGDQLCQWSYYNPALRQPLLASMCVLPSFDQTQYNTLVTPLKTAAAQAQISTQLNGAGFSTASCNLSAVDTFGAHAFDAGTVLVQSLVNSVAQNVLLSNGSGVVSILRNTTIPKAQALTAAATGSIALDQNGDRVMENYFVDFQQVNWLTNTSVVVVGFNWNTVLGISAVAGQTIYWPGNTTSVPSYTGRSTVFIAIQTAKSNPGSIVIGVFGFVGTIALFVYCYRRSKQQQEIESGVHRGGDKEMATTGPQI